jgi:protein-S-isoprenylcysteine O-methyltransferase Ste14
MLALGLVLHWLRPLAALPPLPARLLGGGLLIASVILARRAESVMRQAGTNVRPDQPALTLVASGPFRFSRNPLYLASSGLYLGVSLLVDSLWPIVLLVPTLIILRWGVIGREERYLEAKFGDEYRAYMARVRRWL